MIMYSNTGTRPVDLALKKIQDQKNICCVQIKDNKYHITKSLDKAKLDDIFDDKTPYCLCDEVEKCEGALKPFFNPAVVCASSKGNWIMLKNYIFIPIGSYKKMEDKNIFYLDFEYEQKVKALPYKKSAADTKDDVHIFKDNTARLMWEQLKDLFTPNYAPYYSRWDSDMRCWVNSHDGKPRTPIGYDLMILKTGGWDADWASIAPDVICFEEGRTKGKTIGRIEKFLMKDIEMTKEFARRAAYDMSYQDKEYYLTEMQASFLTLRACLFLKKCNIKITKEALEYMASCIQPVGSWQQPGMEMSIYMCSHIEELFDKVL